MRIRYPVAQNAVMDQADNNDNIAPVEWINGLVMHDLGINQRVQIGKQASQKQKDYLKMFCNSSVGEVPWQNSNTCTPLMT
jgi:hypothetical protein